MTPLLPSPIRSLWMVLLLVASLLLVLTPASLRAQNFPTLSGRVVDEAELLSPAQKAALTAKLEALEKQSQRQLVVVTIPDLGGYDIADYGFRLGDHWGIGNKDRDDGALLIVAPNERKVRIEVGYGLEGVLTDALSARIIRNSIIPKFRENDFPGGIDAGVDAITQLLLLPPEEARKVAAEAAEAEKSSGDGGEMIFVILFVLLFFVLPMFWGRRGGRSYRRGIAPVILWGPGLGGGWGGNDRSGGSSWGSGRGFGGGGGGFGGGGASGGW